MDPARCVQWLFIVSSWILVANLFYRYTCSKKIPQDRHDTKSINSLHDQNGSRINLQNHVPVFNDTDLCSSPLTFEDVLHVSWPWHVDKTELETLYDCLNFTSMCVTDSSRHNIVLMTIVDAGTRDMVDSFIYFLSTRAFIPASKVLFLSLDEITHSYLYRNGLVSFLVTSSMNTPEWHQIAHIKFKMAATIVNMGYAVLVSDLDITYFQNPFSYLNCTNCDIELQTDLHQQTSSYNTGFMYVRSTPSAKRFMLDFSEYLKGNPQVWDQYSFNKKIKESVNHNHLKVRSLRVTLFVPGLINREDEYMYYEPMSEIFDKTVILHHMYLDYHGKVHRMREFGLWMNDQNDYYSNPNQKYLIYDNPLPAYVNHERNSLNNAFKIASILNRIVILPKFHCTRKRKCPADIFGINTQNSCYCSIIHVLQDYHHNSTVQTLFSSFKKNQLQSFREHPFLQHKLIPDKIKSSVSGTILLETELMNKTTELESGFKHKFIPKSLAAGPTRKDIVSWFTPFANVSVLRFKALYGNFAF